MDTRVRRSIQFLAALFTGALVVLAMPAYGEGGRGGGGGQAGHSYSGRSWGGGGEHHGGSWSRGDEGAGRGMTGSERGWRGEGSFGSAAPREVAPRVDRDDMLRRDRDDLRRLDRDDFRFRGRDSYCYSNDDWRSHSGFTELDRWAWANNRFCSNERVPFRHGEGGRDEGGGELHD